jgi:hypothetical protein
VEYERPTIVDREPIAGLLTASVIGGGDGSPELLNDIEPNF